MMGVRWCAAVAVLLLACGGDDARTGLTGASGIDLTSGTSQGTGAGEDTLADSSGDGPPSGPDGCEVGDVDFSFIWVANSPDGTVSKIDTQSAVEVARYRTGPGDDPDPSRTSVDLDGDVAVLNRGGGVTKIAALAERCVDANGDGTIATSTGPDDVLPWGEDECVLWYQELPLNEPEPGDHTWGPRPIAWDAGMSDPDDSCAVFGARLWVGWYSGTASNQGLFWRLDGSTGAVLDEVTVDAWSQIPLTALRPYGAAVDVHGDLWVLGKNNQLVRIDSETLEYQKYYAGALASFYGLAVDAQGNPWIGECNGVVTRFNPASGTFEAVVQTQGCVRGVQVDREGRAWFAGNDPCRLVEVDTQTGTLTNDNIALPGCQTPVGVSIDVEGYVWVVDKDADRAYKVDPDSYAVVQEVDGLDSPYTYSDMTGAGLRLVTFPEG